jgi:hypothetical protein
MNNLFKLYKEEFFKCISKEYDLPIERLDRLHELDNLNVKYWENIQDLSSNSNQYPCFVIFFRIIW